MQANILARYKPRINTSELISTLRHTHKFITDAMGHFRNTRHIVLYYEDLVQNRTVSCLQLFVAQSYILHYYPCIIFLLQKLMDVLEFLIVPPRKLVSRHVKIHTRPLPKLVENWDDVYRSLEGTEYRSFLNANYDL